MERHGNSPKAASQEAQEGIVKKENYPDIVFAA